MRLKPHLKVILATNIVFALVATTLIFVLVFDWKTMNFTSYNFYIFIGAIILALLWIILSVGFNYYRLEDDTLYQRNLYKRLAFDYDDVVFIDDEKAEKEHHFTVYFKNRSHIDLISDSKNILVTELKKRCHNNISYDEFMKRYHD